MRYRRRLPTVIPSYDPVRDFSPVTLATRSPGILVVNPSLPVKSVKELIALARSRPGDLNYASGASGSASHLAAELFRVKSGVRITRINYKSAAAGLVDLISGEVQLMFPVAASVAPYVKSGRLRALAVTTREPSPLVPGTPTLAAAGLPGYEAVSLGGIFAPANLPDPILSRLNQEIVRVLARDDTRERFISNGVESVGSTPAELAAAVRAEMTVIGKLIKDAGIRAE
jgi:tripartite-type tricarboxylate transporter receptor subunit TctC